MHPLSQEVQGRTSTKKKSPENFEGGGITTRGGGSKKRSQRREPKGSERLSKAKSLRGGRKTDV